MIMKPISQKNINAEIISVGSELLLGQIVNTNASYLSKKLSELGINLFRQSVVGDNPARLSSAIKAALSRAEIVMTSGGLGPTVDDITISAISEAISRPLVLNKEIEESIRLFFKKRHLRMPLYVLRQARVPAGALAIKNPVGTAPAVIIGYNGKIITALPGPPCELAPIFENGVVPYLKKRYSVRSIIFTRTIRTAGLPESYINKRIRKFLKMAGAVTVGIYARSNEVDVKITAKSENRVKAISEIKAVEKKILRILGDAVFGFDDDTLELVIGRILAKKKLTLSVAESCTGGLISNRITDVPGSSKYFDRAFVTYSNRSKIEELGVNKNIIERYGAVSGPAAISMAKGALEKAGTDVALAVTGIAGPSGGTKKKPVGHVYIAIALRKKSKKNTRPEILTRCIERFFLGTRTDIKYQASTAALEFLRRVLLEQSGDVVPFGEAALRSALTW